MSNMTDLEHDLEVSLEWWTPNPQFEDDAEVDCEETAKNLVNLGYQKVVWHKETDEYPEYGKNVLGYNTETNEFVVVQWDGDWFDSNFYCYNIDYWADLPKVNI